MAAFPRGNAVDDTDVLVTDAEAGTGAINGNITAANDNHFVPAASFSLVLTRYRNSVPSITRGGIIRHAETPRFMSTYGKIYGRDTVDVNQPLNIPANRSIEFHG
jgi:hypothetical protein